MRHFVSFIFSLILLSFTSFSQVQLIPTGDIHIGSTLKILKTGNVGIGTDTPTEKLDIVGNIALTHSSGGNTAIHQNASNLFIDKDAASGNVLIDINPRPLDSTSNASFRFFRTTNTTGNAKFDVHVGNNTSAVNCSFSGNNKSFTNKNSGDFGVGTATTTAQLTVDGDIHHSGTITMTSDRKLKTNIDKFNGSLAEVLAINTVTFEYTGQGGTANSTGQKIGLIAQELQQISPYLVKQFNYYDTDEEGLKIEGSDRTYLGINDSEIKFLLINAIQELHGELESKDARIQYLETELEYIQDTIGYILSLINQTVDDASFRKTSNQQNVTIYGPDSKSDLSQNIPNPFRESTIINYEVPEKSTGAHMNFFSSEGVLVKSVKVSETGTGQINLKVKNITPGTYYYQLITDQGLIGSKSMIIVH